MFFNILNLTVRNKYAQIERSSICLSCDFMKDLNRLHFFPFKRTQ
jgi:hypothetical protein